MLEARPAGVSAMLGTAACWLAAASVLGAFAWVLGDLLTGGWQALSLEFLFTMPQDAGRAGGILPMLVSTLLILAVALGSATVIGLGAAILLAEYTGRGGWFATLVRRAMDVLAGVPSIVFGLFGNAFFCIWLGMGFSILSGGLTLACMVLPILIRSTEAGIRAVPDSYRHGAAALGLGRSTTLLRVILPAAMPGLVVGLVLGTGRAIAETAALIFTSGYVDRMPGSLLDSGRALSVHIYDLATNVPGGTANAYGAALVLITLLLLINSVTGLLHGRWQRATQVAA